MGRIYKRSFALLLYDGVAEVKCERTRVLRSWSNLEKFSAGCNTCYRVEHHRLGCSFSIAGRRKAGVGLQLQFAEELFGYSRAFDDVLYEDPQRFPSFGTRPQEARPAV